MSEVRAYERAFNAASDELCARFDVSEPSLGTAINTALYSNDYPHMKVLSELTAKDERLSWLRSGWLEHTSHGSVVHAGGIIHYFFRERRRGLSIDQSLQEVWEFAESGESAYARTVALVGISTPEPITLADDLELVPWDNVANTTRKLALESALARENQPFPVRPTAALILRLPRRRVLFASPPDPEDKDAFLRRMQDAEKTDDYVRRAIAFLVIFTLGRVHVCGSFTTLANPVADSVWSTGPSYALGPALMPTIIVQDENVGPLFRRYLQFPHDPGLALSSAISKLAEAAARASIVDKAIDIGTILEMLLLHDLDERGELTYRIRVRGATFLADDDKRVEIYLHLGKLYALRSMAAHRGQLSHDEKTANILTSGMATCAALIKKLIGLGRFPDWEREFVLAAGGERATTRG